MGENETRKPDAGSSTADVTPATSPQAPDTREPSGSGQGNSIPPPPSESLFELVAEAAFVAVATALLGSIPAALRVARAGGSFVGGWIVSASVVVPVLVLLIYMSHAAGRGYRMLTGQGAGRSTALGLALWAGLLSPLLMFLSAVLKEKTNHRGLGGATFGVIALALAILMALVARRLVSAGRGFVERGASARVVAVGFAAIAVGPLLVLSLPLLRHSDTGPHAAAVASALIDGLILAVATAVAVSFGLGDELRARARRVGLPAAGAFVILGFGLLTMSQPLGLALRSGGGLAAALLGGLERWTDRDGDGAGALFGGADCDEGDPRRHPGATDVAGDGIDQDCDGIDGAPVAKRDTGAGVLPAAAGMAADPPPASTPAPVPASRPSIVLVTLDTVRADWTSAFGYKDYPTTPRLEELAKQGVSFGGAFAPGSDTQRAFIHLFSGRPLEETAKDRREWPTLKDENVTIAERLKDAGYLTAAVSSFQWISKERGFSQGFEHFVEVFEEEHPERGTTGPHAVRAARAFLEKTASDPKPVFLWVHLFDAHSEYRRKTGFDFGKGDAGAYRSEIGFVDKQLGDLVDAIAASSRAKTTAIIVHGSQGEAFEEHGSSGHGKDLHAEVLHVPLVITLPGEPGGRRVDGAVSTADIPATILSLAQGSLEGVAGASLLPLARGEPGAKREPVYARGSKRFAVIDHPLKLILQERKGRDRTLLFDIAADPGEKRDLSEERAEDLNRLSALLRERFKLKAERDPD